MIFEFLREIPVSWTGVYEEIGHAKGAGDKAEEVRGILSNFRLNLMRKRDIEYWYVNQQAYLKKKARNSVVHNHHEEKGSVDNELFFEKIIPMYFLITKNLCFHSKFALNKWLRYLGTNGGLTWDTLKTKGMSYFSIQEMEQNPVKFMLQVRSMEQIPENMLKLKSFREHLNWEQEVDSNLFYSFLEPQGLFRRWKYRNQ